LENTLRRLDRRLAYRGGIIDIYKDKVELPDGRIEEWDDVHHKKGGGACVVPVLPDGRILLIRQMRPIIGRETLELPAGCRDEGEDGARTAARELFEETGMRAGRLTFLAALDTAVAWCDESTEIYLAEDLTDTGSQHLDEAEAIRTEPYELAELLDKISRKEIRDAKTVAGIFAYTAIKFR